MNNRYNILNNKISIEDINGNCIMEIVIDKSGNIIEFNNCEIADIDNNIIRVQQIEKNF